MEKNAMTMMSRAPHEAIKESLMPRSVTIYYDELSGAIYIEDDGDVFEMTADLNVTGEVSLSNMEALKTYDPTELSSNSV